MKLDRLAFIFVIFLATLILHPNSSFAAEKLKVAVADLDALGVPENIALSTSELFRTELFKTGYFHVLERKQMTKILEEHALQLSGALQAEDAAEIGNLLSVHLIVFGSINQLGRNLVITIRLVNVEEGRLKAADSANSNGLEGIQAAVRKLSKIIAESIPLRGKVVKIRGDEIIVSLGRLDQVDKGDFLRVQRLGETFKDPSTGRVLGREIIEVATLKVESVINDELSRTFIIEEHGSISSGDIVIIWTGSPGERPVVKIPEVKVEPAPAPKLREMPRTVPPQKKKRPALPPPSF